VAGVYKRFVKRFVIDAARVAGVYKRFVKRFVIDAARVAEFVLCAARAPLERTGRSACKCSR
jgi:hypothetical protein